jgi:hypothetical protein
MYAPPPLARLTLRSLVSGAIKKSQPFNPGDGRPGSTANSLANSPSDRKSTMIPSFDLVVTSQASPGNSPQSAPVLLKPTIGVIPPGMNSPGVPANTRINCLTPKVYTVTVQKDLVCFERIEHILLLIKDNYNPLCPYCLGCINQSSTRWNKLL